MALPAKRTERAAALTVLLALALAPMLHGCAVGPDFKSPDAPKAERYTAQSLPAATTAVPVAGGESQAFRIGQQLPARWWTLFGSATLDQRVDQAFDGSPTVDAAEASLRQAHELLRAQAGSLYPSVDANAGAQRQKLSLAAFGGGGGDAIFNLFNASVGVSYGLDLFGGVRRGIEAQAAQVDYQRYELQAAYQTLAANVVTASVLEASLRSQLAATGDIADAEQKQLAVTERQFALGAVSQAEVLSARSNLASTRAALAPLHKQLAQARNLLAVYAGRLPSEGVTGDLQLSQLKLPRELPVELPSALVRQRPDVRASEALLHAASANVGVATANMFPQLSITGSFGAESTSTRTLFDGSIWSIGAGLTAPLFRGGELNAKRRAAIAAYDQASAQYRQTVLTAFQNVADSLNALTIDADALKAQYDAVSAAGKSLQLTEKQYALGAVSYLDLLTAQRQYQQSRIAYVQALASRYQDTVALFQSLGGDWQVGASRRPASAGTP